MHKRQPATRGTCLSKWLVENVQVLVVVLSWILASLRRKTGTRLLLGPSKDGNGNTMLPTRVGYDVIKTRATAANDGKLGESLEAGLINMNTTQLVRWFDVPWIHALEKFFYPLIQASYFQQGSHHSTYGEVGEGLVHFLM